MESTCLGVVLSKVHKNWMPGVTDIKHLPEGWPVINKAQK